MSKSKSMVKQVARAICWAAGMDPDLTLGGDGENFLWHEYERPARAAIEAMQKPSPRMLRAACKSMSPDRRPTSKHVGVKAKHAIRYRAMIEAALNEEGGQ